MTLTQASKNYSDYFIRAGRFIGAFDEMYRNCEDPWQQDEGSSLAEEVALLMLREATPRRILDIGCGRGRFSNQLRAKTGATIVATDISLTAVLAAHLRHPDIVFLAAKAPALPFRSHSFDLVVTNGLLWCVLPELPILFSEITRVLVPQGNYLILETFYQPGQQQYGNEVMEKPEDLLRQLPFRLKQLVEVDRLLNHRMIALVSPS